MHFILCKHKINLGICCEIQALCSMIYNNSEWNITYTNIESLCRAPEANIILLIKYSLIKKREKSIQENEARRKYDFQIK